MKFRAHHDVPDGEVAAEPAPVLREQPVPEAVRHDVVDLLGALEAHAGDEVVEATLAHEARVEEVVRQVERLLSQLPVRHLHPGRHKTVPEPGKSSGLGKVVLVGNKLQARKIHLQYRVFKSYPQFLIGLLANTN